jgi:hypothetical protein
MGHIATENPQHRNKSMTYRNRGEANIQKTSTIAKQPSGKCCIVACNLKSVRYLSRTILRAAALPFQLRRYMYTPDGSPAPVN